MLQKMPDDFQEPDIARELFAQKVLTKNQCFNIKTLNYQYFLKVQCILLCWP